MYEKYLKTIENNLNLLPETMYFKNDFEYRGVLEHVSYEYGLDYLNMIKEDYYNIYKNNKDLFIELCIKNDIYGKPIKYDYIDFIECSPTNLRYIYHALVNLDYMKSKDLNNVNIIELGGGYGGLCFFMKNLSKLFNININSYTIFDLPLVIKLQNKYLQLLNINDVNLFTLDDNDTSKLFKNSYCISNYGFSEFNRDIQNRYINEVINKYVSNGLFVYNCYDTYIKFTINDVLIMDEKPNFPNNNKFIYF
jgi:hypothetical protein